MEDDITLACSMRYLMVTAYKVVVSKSERISLWAELRVNERLARVKSTHGIL
jgi:hypothetical protein